MVSQSHVFSYYEENHKEMNVVFPMKYDVVKGGNHSSCFFISICESSVSWVVSKSLQWVLVPYFTLLAN